MKNKTLRWKERRSEKKVAVNPSGWATKTNSRQQEASVVPSASVTNKTDTNFVCLAPNFGCLERSLFQLKRTSIRIMSSYNQVW